MSELISIIVADDHPLFREGVVSSLQDSGYFDVVAQAGSHEDTIEQTERHLPELILLDVSMPGGGVETAEIIAKRTPIVKIVMLTVSEHKHDVQKALSAQAQGYILKGVESAELIDILKGIHHGETYISPTLAENLLMRSNIESASEEYIEGFNLNEREQQILERLSAGLSNREMADELYLSEKTIKHYMTNIMHKLQVSNRVQAAIKAYKLSHGIR